MKKVNYTLFLLLAVLIFCFCCALFLNMLPSDSGPDPSHVSTVLENIALFPAITLLEDLFTQSLFLVFTGFLLNSFFYAFLIERLVAIFKILVKKK